MNERELELEQGFLQVIQQNPDDDSAIGIYADWLEERGEMRGEYLRLFLQVRSAPKRMKELSKQIDRKWLAKIPKAPKVVSERVFLVKLKNNETVKVIAHTFYQNTDEVDFRTKTSVRVGWFPREDVLYVTPGEG